MKHTSYLIFFILSSCLLYFSSCKKDQGGSESKTSVSGGTESHDVGEACMRCHNTGGSNKYWWVVAGTVYMSDSISLNPNGMVYFYTGSTGSGNLITSIPVDGKGNFYTTNSLAFGNGIYPAVKSLSGQIRFMSSAITQGDCNSCHKVSNRIIVN
jgi:hypothetical protein